MKVCDDIHSECIRWVMVDKTDKTPRERTIRINNRHQIGIDKE